MSIENRLSQINEILRSFTTRTPKIYGLVVPKPGNLGLIIMLEQKNLIN